MRVHDPNAGSEPNVGSVATTRASRAQGIGRNGASGRTNGTTQSEASDDIHLSELVRSLRSLASDSPERQARIDQIASDYANRDYKVDAQATASKIIDESTGSSSGS